MKQIVTSPGGVAYVSEAPAKRGPEKISIPEMKDQDLTAGERLLNVFRVMPEEAQIELFARLKYAFLHRGGGGILPTPRDGLTHELADVFYRYGHEQEEYT